VLGRFLSADTLTPGGPEGLNRYSYVGNDPINFNDPSGHMASEWDEYLGGNLTVRPTSFISQNHETTSYISQNNVDSGYTFAFIGGVPATQPYGKTAYGDIEDSCNGCSAEGGGYDPYGIAGIIADVAGAGLTAKAIYDEDDIAVYVAYLQDNGIQINSLYINNKTNQAVSVMSVDFITREYANARKCFIGTCLFPAPQKPYSVKPGPSIHAKGTYVGLGPVASPGGQPIGFTTRIPLVPSGNATNPNNNFFWYMEVTINLRLAYTDTGSYWPLISYTFGR
jgi:hypothetical protein